MPEYPHLRCLILFAWLELDLIVTGQTLYIEAQFAWMMDDRSVLQKDIGIAVRSR